jgi:uncharacterized low-complexity protein
MPPKIMRVGNIHGVDHTNETEAEAVRMDTVSVSFAVLAINPFAATAIRATATAASPATIDRAYEWRKCGVCPEGKCRYHRSKQGAE